MPSNSVFKMAETAGAEDYVPEWSGLADISPEVALSGVPVQLALTSTPSEPPIPVSADVFPLLRGEDPVAAPKDPVWKVEAPLAAPVDQLFPMAASTPAASAFPPAPAPAATVPAAALPAASTAPPPAPFPAPFAAIGAPISPHAAGPTLSAEIFPVAAPISPAPVAPVPVAPVPAPIPQPAGDAFPGIVPTAAPMAAPAAPPTLPPSPAAPTTFAEPPAPAPAPAAASVPTPVPTALAPVPPQPTVYTGPPPVQLATNPVAPPDFQPFAASTPGATYVPLTPRPIPQPLQLGAPAAPATSPDLGSAMPGATVAPPTPQPAPAEYWPTQGAPSPGAPIPGVQYQPDPGAYVPFDPNAVHLEPMPMIPFSSRDPYNSASTARPGMRAYAAGPVGPTGSTWTGGLAFMLLAPLISTAAFFVWTQLTPFTQLSAESAGWLPFALGGIFLLSLAAAQIDRSALARRGYFDLASPFWVLLMPPLVYLIVRALRLRGQGKGAGAAIGLWVLSYVGAYALTILVSFGWLSAPTPARVAFVESTMQQQLAAKNITATVSCPAVTSFAPGSTFDCTVTPQQGSSLLFRITVKDWTGGFTAAPVSSSTS